MINRNRQTGQAKRQSVNFQTGVAQDDSRPDNKDERIHRNPLIPAQNARRQFHYLAEKKAADARHQSDDPRHIRQGII